MQNKLPYNITKERESELQKVIKIILKYVKPEMIILFGSYARGDFVEYDAKQVEGHIESYASDFDILIVLRNKKITKEYDVWFKIEDEIDAKDIKTHLK